MTGSTRLVGGAIIAGLVASGGSPSTGPDESFETAVSRGDEAAISRSIGGAPYDAVWEAFRDCILGAGRSLDGEGNPASELALARIIAREFERSRAGDRSLANGADAFERATRDTKRTFLAALEESKGIEALIYGTREWDEASRRAAAFVAASREIGAPVFIVRALMAAGSAEYARLRTKAARDLLEEADALASRVGSASLRAAVAKDLAAARSRLGDKLGAIAVLESNLGALRTPRSEAGGQALWTLGDLYGDMARFEDAVSAIEESLTHLTPGNDTYAFALESLGSQFLALGRLGKARSTLEQAVRILEQQTPGPQDYRAPRLAGCHLDLARIAEALDDPAGRVRHLDVARRFGESSPNPGIRIRLAIALGNAALSAPVRDVAAAEARFTEAVTESDRRGFEYSLVSALCSRAAFRTDAGRLDEARADLLRSKGLAEAGGFTEWAAVASARLGIVARRLGDPAAARSHFVSALDLSRGSGPSSAEYAARLGLCRLEAEAGRHGAAIEELREAISLGRIPDRELLSDTDVIGDRSRRAFLYDWGIELAAKRFESSRSESDAVLALRFSEARRSQTLRDALLSAASSEFEPDGEFASRRADLLAKIDGLSIGYRWRADTASPAGEVVGRRTRELEESFAALERLESTLAGPAPDVLSSELGGLRDVRSIRERLLGPGEVLLEYALGKDRSTLIVMSNDDVRIVGLPPGRRIATLVESVHDAMARDDRDRFAEDAAELDRLLLRCAGAGVAAAERLLIVPDAELQYLPFEMLLSADAQAGPAAAWSDLQYRVRRQVIRYAPSVEVLGLLRDRPPAEGTAKDLLAFAYPGPGAAVTAGGFVSRSTTLADVWRLPLLTNARPEVDSLCGLFDRCDAFYDDRATESRLAAQLSRERYRYVHFAAHGIANERSARLSGLVLAPESDPPRDGFLWLLEIAALPIRCDMVTLSACDTGRGLLTKSEGAIALPRAFLRAGAKSVVTSVAPVSDESAPDLMRRFYARIRDGADRAAALRDSKLELIDSRTALAAPRHWAPFLYVGE